MFNKIISFIFLASLALLLRTLLTNFLPDYIAVSLVNLLGSFIFIYVFFKSNNRFFLIVFCGTFTTFSGVFNLVYHYYQSGYYLNSLFILMFNLLIIPLITLGYFNKKGYLYE